MKVERHRSDHMRTGHHSAKGFLTFDISVSGSFLVPSRILDDLCHVLGKRTEVSDSPKVEMKLSRGHGLQVLLRSFLHSHGDDSHPIFPQSLGSLSHVILGLSRSQDHQDRGKQLLVSPVCRSREIGPVSLPESISNLQGATHEREVLLEVVQHGVLALEGAQLEFTVEPVAVLGQGQAVFSGLYGEAVDNFVDERFHKREGLNSQVIRAVHQKHDICIFRAWAYQNKMTNPNKVILQPLGFRPQSSFETVS